MSLMSRNFKGVWICRQIWLRKDLTAAEKALWAEIDSLYDEKRGGCYASNEYLIEFCGFCGRQVQKMLTKLKNLGLLELVSFDGRTRIIKALFPSDMNGSHQTRTTVHGKSEPEFTPSPEDIHTIENKEEKKDLSARDESAIRLERLLFEKIKEINPERKPLTEKESIKWRKDLSLMMEEDKRTEESIEKVICWFCQDAFWIKRIYNAEHLRKHFETMHPQINPKKTNEQINRELTIQVIKECEPNLKHIKVFKTYVVDSLTQKDLYFANHPPEQFKSLFLNLCNVEEE